MLWNLVAPGYGPIPLNADAGYPAGTIYVSKTATNGFAVGSDSNTLAQSKASNRQTPFLTVSRAVSQASNGDLIVINDGSYTTTELGALSYVLVTGKGLRFKAYQTGQVTFLGSVATAVYRVNGQTAGFVNGLDGIILDGAGIANYCVLDDDASASLHTLTLNNCRTVNPLLRGVHPACAKVILNLFNWVHTGVTRSGLYTNTLASPSTVSIIGGSTTLTAMNNAQGAIDLTAVDAGVSVSISGHTVTGTLDNSLTSTGAHYGIIVANVTNVAITNNSVTMSGTPGSRVLAPIRVYAAAALAVTAPVVSGNAVVNNGLGGYGICLGNDASGAGNSYVTDPVVNDNTVTAVPATQTTPVHGILLGFNQGGSVLRNTVIGCGLALIQKMNTVTGALFADNTIRSPYSIGMYAKGAVNTRFVHNSVYVTDTANGSDAVTVLQALDDDGGTHSTGVEFSNNAVHIAGNVLTKFVSVGASNTATFASNLYFSDFSLPANPFTYQGTSYASVALWAAAQEATAVSGDPKFVDAANDNFRLQATSAARGAGSVASGVTTDKAGVAFASPPSIGAYEYVA